MQGNNRGSAVRHDSGEHPFVEWYAALLAADAARCQGRDIILGDFAGKRFTVGVDQDARPVLGILEADIRPVMSFKWYSAAFVRRHLGRDWIALSCRDARIEDAEEMSPVPLRLFIPVSSGLMDVWSELEPKRLRLRAVAAEKGQGVALQRPPLAEIPLQLKGFSKKP